MYQIIHKHVLAEGIKRLDVMAPAIASRVFPGQFAMLKSHAQAKSMPMTIVDWDERKQTISFIVHEIGLASRELGQMAIGEQIVQITGPLGRPATIDRFGTVIAVATGIGAAQILPLCRALKRKGNRVIGIIGAKSKNVLMLESQMRVLCDDIFITTNDGSYERKGLATQVLSELLKKMPVHAVYAIGGADMMRTSVQLAQSKNIPVWVMPNTYMTDGLGICGSCRLIVDGRIQLSCIDGPIFDGTKVDFADLIKRAQHLERVWKNTTPNTNRSPNVLQTYVKSLWAWPKK